MGPETLYQLDHLRPYIVAGTNTLLAASLLKDQREGFQGRIAQILGLGGVALSAADLACETMTIDPEGVTQWLRETLSTLYGGLGGILLYERAAQKRDTDPNGANTDTFVGTLAFTGISVPSGLPQLALPEIAATLSTGTQWLGLKGAPASVLSTALPVVSGAVAFHLADGPLAKTTALSLTAIGLGLGNLSSEARKAFARYACIAGALGMVVSNAATTWELAPSAIATVPFVFTLLNAKFGRDMSRT